MFWTRGRPPAVQFLSIITTVRTSYSATVFTLRIPVPRTALRCSCMNVNSKQSKKLLYFAYTAAVVARKRSVYNCMTKKSLQVPLQADACTEDPAEASRTQGKFKAIVYQFVSVRSTAPALGASSSLRVTVCVESRSTCSKSSHPWQSGFFKSMLVVVKKRKKHMHKEKKEDQRMEYFASRCQGKIIHNNMVQKITQDMGHWEISAEWKFHGRHRACISMGKVNIDSEENVNDICGFFRTGAKEQVMRESIK